MHGTHRKAQSLVEYALILVLVSIVAVAALRAIGTKLERPLDTVSGNLPS